MSDLNLLRYMPTNRVLELCEHSLLEGCLEGLLEPAKILDSDVLRICHKILGGPFSYPLCCGTCLLIHHHLLGGSRVRGRHLVAHRDRDVHTRSRAC